MRLEPRCGVWLCPIVAFSRCTSLYLSHGHRVEISSQQLGPVAFLECVSPVLLALDTLHISLLVMLNYVIPAIVPFGRVLTLLSEK
ncbi:hypothetical protein DACRYDRAFT_23439 [Dacryopinax primogenitus]|uniref:Uncharacterized protein n=1 Tax=Dacryopinax primogenitus (strain DJM 731) TaxID=1858805 RepID=M5FRQ0_DACPD|nr:uncharacterized protein DACRYDRAFT_23439 [Dacryopinax primogenitus]EJT99880.1 hypothetical protein DACRYDRAFT_23439 [Dacryopinax primogenitus]